MMMNDDDNDTELLVIGAQKLPLYPCWNDSPVLVSN